MPSSLLEKGFTTMATAMTGVDPSPLIKTTSFDVSTMNPTAFSESNQLSELGHHPNILLIWNILL